MTSFTELARGQCRDPFSFLGIHPVEDGWEVRVFLPWARKVELIVEEGRRPMRRSRSGAGGWSAVLAVDAHARGSTEAPAYRLAVTDPKGTEWERDDPYRFPPSMDVERIRGFLMGRERRAHQFMGAHPHAVGPLEGTRFAVWAPNARAVHVVGDMNGWDGRCTPMGARGDTGVWEIFLPGVGPGARYKYRIVTTDGHRVEKSDPFGRAAEVRPAQASAVAGPTSHVWGDHGWMESRAERHADGAPMSVYEVHAGSWRRHEDGSWLGYRELADTILPYVKELGFTHVEFLPLAEHPLDQSWGYQPVGFFAPTSRFGTPDDLRYLVGQAHEMDLGVLLDWVPGHFAADAHGLARFDGMPLFEPEDAQKALHPDWGTVTFDFARPEVRSFLISSALYWLEEFHIDGLRVDAVASMLHLDYSRGPGQWTPNREGGNIDLDAVDVLRAVNDAVHEEVPGASIVAEESTAWDGVTRSTEHGGLGFDLKWSLGWMNDTLGFMQTSPDERINRYEALKLPMSYAWSERFLLPLSHDEVVHGKRSLIGRMPGTDQERLANLRLLLAWQWMHPGKKLLFMGGELGQPTEWSVDGQVDWSLESDPGHDRLRHLVRDLNQEMRGRSALHALDHRPEGFGWLISDRPEEGLLAFVRWAPERRDPLVVVANFGAHLQEDLPVPVPHAGVWRTVLDTDDPTYGGSGRAMAAETPARAEALGGWDHHVRLRVPALSLLALAPD